MILILLLAALVFNLLAQGLLKHAVNGLGDNGFSIGYITKLVVNPYIISGAVVYGLSFFFYVLALSKGDLSKVSPVSQALTTIGVVLISVIAFNEPLTISKILGIALLMIGTYIIFNY
ncbi:hypothetical protein PAECIP111893_00436 [Paenibacillus plantiphilus]|uniref:EamA domain-containing protein n=1 Tax=Paenibacillus plantiphilus TaxID=2905650 RepID=A0ABM9BU20_9BACL|nr:EamA family transporter [Paenibacillus plantiphilus]CAH1193333.1 hypothetical protein PAECIP111893_00436 [Paenibacillus plantiphilus]